MCTEKQSVKRIVYVHEAFERKKVCLVFLIHHTDIVFVQYILLPRACPVTPAASGCTGGLSLHNYSPAAGVSRGIWSATTGYSQDAHRLFHVHLSVLRSGCVRANPYLFLLEVLTRGRIRAARACFSFLLGNILSPTRTGPATAIRVHPYIRRQTVRFVLDVAERQLRRSVFRRARIIPKLLAMTYPCELVLEGLLSRSQSIWFLDDL
jgi:hypothetical protein